MSIEKKQYQFTRTTLPIPYDLLHLIVQELVSTSSFGTLAKLCSVSRDYHSIIIPLLYTHVHITSDEQLQSFLTIPLTKEEVKIKRKNNLVKNVLGVGVKRGRSGSLKGITDHSHGYGHGHGHGHGQSKNNKLNNLSLLKTLKLDIYPSRSSFKLSSKLPNPLQCHLLEFTNLAVGNLYDKLSRSGAPRILVSFWSGHLPNFVQPQKIIVDYSNLDLSDDGNAEGGGIMKDEKWLDTMTGMSISLQSWSDTIREVELRGNNWFGILPSPGVKVRMVHTTNPTSTSPLAESASTNEGEQQIQVENHEEQEELVTVNETLLNPPPSEPNASRLASIEARNKLISLRTKSLILGLRSSQALYENYNLPSSVNNINWEIVNFLPPPLDHVEDEEERLIEDQKEKRQVLENVMRVLDESCPTLMRNYARIGGESGRRELTCLTWIN